MRNNVAGFPDQSVLQIPFFDGIDTFLVIDSRPALLFPLALDAYLALEGGE